MTFSVQIPHRPKSQILGATAKCHGRREATRRVLQILEEWGSESKFIWLRELHRITDIDKGLLRNIINGLKKSREIEMHGANSRVFFCLKRYHVECMDAEFRFKGKGAMPRDGSGTGIIRGATKSTERTRKRLEKQKSRRRAKSFTKAKRPHRS